MSRLESIARKAIVPIVSAGLCFTTACRPHEYAPIEVNVETVKVRIVHVDRPFKSDEYRFQVYNSNNDLIVDMKTNRPEGMIRLGSKEYFIDKDRHGYRVTPQRLELSPPSPAPQ